MEKVYTFGTLRFTVYETGMVKVEGLYGDDWHYQCQTMNPGFACFLKERAERDV